ncbi:hypothetical protein [Leuconostoc gasicomitatum]|uniref:hypothetical protein n=1 Tax=Leuconostoc gasicomitatum TaxID=115778 RepID=UPI001CC6690C|nr:hypothetical protein [Leuconostoc gasicomitatum]MBZ5946020.1 hypothetical protein [Leuconostoc gasicomitatum]
MINNKALIKNILKSIRASVITLMSWFIGNKIYEFFNDKINLTLIIAVIAIVINALFEFIINFISKKTTKVTVLFGCKSKFYESEFKLLKESFVEDVTKITLKITVEGNISNVNNKFIDIHFPSRTLFTLEADDQSGKTLNFKIDDGENTLQVFLPNGTQRNAKFVYSIKIKLTKNTEVINFDNGAMLYLKSEPQTRKKYDWLVEKNILELRWNKLSADAE